jgi:hypothetical protein
MKRAIVMLGRGLFVAGCGSGSSSSEKAATTASTPQTGGRHFVAQIDNPWFPLKPGTTFVYRGEKDGKTSRDVVTVTNRTRTIKGVRTTAVSDKLYLNGPLGERTTDWYAQDAAGNVWYFGEATAELDAHGKVTSTEGSWLAGVNGAREGIYLPGNPRVGQTALQEYLKGHAEDHFRVKSLSAKVTTPGASSSHALLTEEWTPLEPGVLDHKLYVRGVGQVREDSVKGGNEHAKLISVHPG